MFKQNKYTRIYDSIINRAKNRLLSEYKERHHIIPKSLGGNNDGNNLVDLTAREHYIAHWLLTKMVIGQDAQHKMACAFYYTCYGTKKQDKKYNSRQYERAKKIMSESKKGRRYTSEACKMAYQNSWLKQWNGSKEQKEHLSKVLTGRKYTQEHCNNISKGKQIDPFPKGNPMDKEECRNKVRNSKIGLKKLIKGDSVKMALPDSDKWNTLIADGYIQKC